MLRCTVCQREVRPWPLRRPKACAPARWVHCIRTEDDPKVVIA